LDGLRRVRDLIGRIPLVAIGGITAQNAAKVISAGADAVAVISALLTDPAQIKVRTLELQSGL
jgi:thiamine monophosphate synthase